MNKNVMNNGVLLVIVVVLASLGIAGGTYALLTYQMNITNNSYNTMTHCLIVNYTDNTDQITGTLFPSAVPVKGLSGSVSLKIDPSCNINGKGSIKLHINSTTSSALMSAASSHCESRNTNETLSQYNNKTDCENNNGKWIDIPTSYCEDKNTYAALKDYKTESTCTSNGGKWTTGASPLKYALYDGNNTNNNPIAKGYIESSNINGEMVIYNNFPVTKTQKSYYLYIWLDGTLTSNVHTNLQFSGYVPVEVVQDLNKN